MSTTQSLPHNVPHVVKCIPASSLLDSCRPCGVVRYVCCQLFRMFLGFPESPGFPFEAFTLQVFFLFGRQHQCLVRCSLSAPPPPWYSSHNCCLCEGVYNPHIADMCHIGYHTCWHIRSSSELSLETSSASFMEKINFVKSPSA